MAVKKAGNYVEALNPKGYVNNREITNLEGHFLVKGSKNTKIVNGEKVVVRPGFEVLGADADVNNGILGSIDWKTNTGVYRNIRSYWANGSDKAELEVWWDSAWTRIKNGFESSSFEFVPWWSPDELMDLLLMVNGDDKVRMWSGGIAEIASVTSDTLTKKGYLAASTIAFNDNGDDPDTITDTASGFLTAGFAAGDMIEVTGSGSNDGVYEIVSVTAGVITLGTDPRLMTEAAGASVVIGWENNDTWAKSRFLVNTANRSVRIGGIDYTYTGGENTGTLTGLTRNPEDDGVIAGDLAIQSVMEYEPAALDGEQNDFIEVFFGHVIIGSYTSRRIFLSANDDFTDFTYTTPVRKPGEGFILTFDSTPNTVVPDENDLYVSAGDDDWYRVYMELNADQQGETVIIKKLKTAPGQAALGPAAVARVKNYIAYINKAKAIDSLGAVENISGVQSLNISDPIRDDMLAYDFTNAHIRYWRESVYVALPAELKVLEFDMRYNYWQPPYDIPVSRIAIIDDELCGHSATTNETYKLETGYNDNGVAINAIAAFGYENFGTRFMLKNFSQSAHELYMSRSTEVKKTINYDYKGASGTVEFLITAADNDATVFVPATGGPLGSVSLGEQPLGGDEIDILVKKREVNRAALKDFFERQVIFSTESMDGQFQLLAYGENIHLSENVPANIIR